MMAESEESPADVKSNEKRVGSFPYHYTIYSPLKQGQQPRKTIISCYRHVMHVPLSPAAAGNETLFHRSPPAARPSK